jgi:hypothetical protein
MKNDYLRLGTCMAGLGLASPIDSRSQSASMVSGSMFDFGLYICSCKLHTGHPQAAAPGDLFCSTLPRVEMCSHSNLDMGVPLGAV